jgi:hypothetical protein
MPATQLFPSTPPLAQLRLTLEDQTLTTLDPSLRLWVAGQPLDGDWKTLGTVAYPGMATDLVPSDISDTVAAWLWGDERDVVRSLPVLSRVARRYHTAHPMD